MKFDRLMQEFLASLHSDNPSLMYRVQIPFMNLTQPFDEHDFTNDVHVYLSPA